MGIMDALGGKKKPSEGPGIDVEIGEAAKQSRINKRALKESEPESEPESESEKTAPAGKPSPIKPVKGPYGSQPGEKRLPVDEWLKDAPKMHGGGMVKKTGPHILLKGEAVLNKKDTKKMSALGGGQPDSGPTESPDEMNIKKLDDGSFHITHHNTKAKEPMPNSKNYSARNGKHLVRHVRQAFVGGSPQAEPDGDES